MTTATMEARTRKPEFVCTTLDCGKSVADRKADPFATAPKPKPNTHAAPKDDPELGDVSGGIAEFVEAKAAYKAADDTHATLCGMFGEDAVESDLVDSDWTFTVSRERMADEGFKARLTKALQAEFSDDEIPTIFEREWSRKSRKGVLDKAAGLCGGDVDKVEALLSLTVPAPTVK